MDITERMTEHLKGALKNAITMATRQGYSIVYPEHLLLGLLNERGSIAGELLYKYGCNKKSLLTFILRHAKHKNLKPVAQFAKPSAQCIEKAVLIGAKHSHVLIGTEHLLLALLEQKDRSVIRAVESTKIDHKELAAYVRVILKSISKFQDFQDAVAMTTDTPHAMPHTHAPSATPTKGATLAQYARDLTSEKTQESIDPIIGRHEEIERLIHILCRKTKNNPLLIGDPGVGKTAIVEGLAQRIMQGKVPAVLQGKRILGLDLGLLIAGTVYRGEFESRFKAIMQEIKSNPSLIVFIDEVHTIVGAGATSGSMDAANLIKPALSRGEMRCIGATTHEEYKKHIEHDPALDRRFGKIQISEPTADKTLNILEGIRDSYEQYHNVSITDEALKAAIDGAHRHFPSLFFPDKAIDLVDEAAAAAASLAPADPQYKKRTALEQELALVVQNKANAVASEDFEQALSLKEKEAKMRAALAKITKKKPRITKSQSTITATDIAKVISRRTGTSVAAMQQDRTEQIPAIAAHLNEHIVGQAAARAHIITTIQKGMLGLHTTTRPMASFVFVGPSGSGKTHTAKHIAQAVYGSADNCITIDMSEYKESYSVSKLIGSPAGYVGYREQTSLTDRIKRQPFSVLLFDEIDKAHPDVHNLFLQMLDTGKLTDATGKSIDLSHTIIILTTTAGADRLSGGGIGFTNTTTPKSAVRKALEDVLRSEILNRIDHCIVFNPLTKTDLAAITRRAISAYTEKIKSHGITVHIEDSLIEWIARSAIHSPQMGRTVYTIIDSQVLPLITQRILDGTVSTATLRHDGKTILCE